MVLTDELTSTSAVAARAAAREVVNGSKDEGVVPVTLHLEEVGQTMTVIARSICVCLSDHSKVVMGLICLFYLSVSLSEPV